MTDTPAPDDRARRFVREGHRLNYRDEGAGPALVLLHGWTFDLDMWEPQARALRARWRVLRVDRRGFGQSDGPASIEDDARDLLALCDHLGLARIAVLGMSQGARVAVRFCGLAPERAACAILDGTPSTLLDASAAPDPDLAMPELRHIAREQGIDAFKAVWARHRLAHTHSADPQIRELVARILRRYRGTDLLEPLPGVAPVTGLEAIACPTLVLSGALDGAGRREAARAIALRIAGARWCELADAGHLANLDQPDAYCAVLEKFLRTHQSVS